MATKLRCYHSAVWDEPLVMEMGAPGRRGCLFPAAEDEVAARCGPVSELLPATLRRDRAPDLPEMSEPDVLRHYLHLSQQTLGMMGISLFGTCTMKYNPRLVRRPRDAALRWPRSIRIRTPSPRCRVCSSSSTGSTRYCASSPAWISSSSSPRAVPMRPTRTPASRGLITLNEESWSRRNQIITSNTGASLQSRQPRRRPGSKSSR